MPETVSETGGPRRDTTDHFFDWRYVRGLREPRRHYRMAFLLFWSILVGYFVHANVVSVGLVVDKSMHPSLGQEGYYLVNRYVYRFVAPKRGDIVVFKRTPDATVLDAKRVIALPGETLLIQSGDVYIDGERLVEPYAVGKTHPELGPYTVADGTYYVLGDNRWVREDSREFGPLPRKKIAGKITPGKLFAFW